MLDEINEENEQGFEDSVSGGTVEHVPHLLSPYYSKTQCFQHVQQENHHQVENIQEPEQVHDILPIFDRE